VTDLPSGPRSVVIEADGGSRGNPGPSSYGAVLKDAVTGEVIAEDGTTIGVATNNVAEYSGLIAGLRLAERYAPGADREYATALAIFLDLGTLCAQDPGTVLASPDDGSAILFHTDCSVIANNFILRQPDKAHIDEVTRLMQLSPAEIRLQRPDVKYVFVRALDVSKKDGDSVRLAADSPIAKELFIDQTPPMGYTLVKTVRMQIGEGGPSGVYARLYKVEPIDAPETVGAR
jgi:hypothetical protein